MVDKVLNALGEVGIYYQQLYVIWSVLALMAVSLLIVFRKQRKRLWWRAGVLILLVLMARWAMFENPVAWRAYRKLLNVNQLGFRHDAEVDIRIRRFWTTPQGRPDSPSVPFLAVGSSQTGALFKTVYSLGPDVSEQIEFFSMAGMGPLDILLYKDDIFNYGPNNIILYLSEATLTHRKRAAAGPLFITAL